MLSGIEIFCFAASYTVTLGLEVSRLFFRASVRVAIMIAFAIAGVIAQSLYLVQQARQAQGALPLSSWFHWCLIAALVLAMIYVYLALSRPGNTVGMFILPMVLGMIALAYVFQNADPFPRREAIFRIGMVHGITLLLGTVAALLGFSAGLMYLVQDYRLKHKLPPKPGLRLPSLEWLHTINERALVTSGLFLLLGLASGAILNLYRSIESPRLALSWNDPVVWFSGLLFAWLAVALLFNLCYRPAREGHKVVYLTLASCVLLALVMTVVLFSSSAHPPQAEAAVDDAASVVGLATANPKRWDSRLFTSTLVVQGRGERGEGGHRRVSSFPRSAWERTVRRSASLVVPSSWEATTSVSPFDAEECRVGTAHQWPSFPLLMVGNAHPTASLLEKAVLTPHPRSPGRGVA